MLAYSQKSKQHKASRTEDISKTFSWDHFLINNILPENRRIKIERRLELLYFLSRLAPMVFGFFGAYLCTIYLSQESQGVFFLMLSFVSAQVVFEGGMYYQMQQKVAVLLKRTGNLNDELSNGEVAAFWYKSLVFLFIMSSLYFFLVYHLAHFMLDKRLDEEVLNLALFFAVISIRFIISGIEAILEGANYRAYVAKTRLVSSIVNGLALCGFLFNGNGLDSLILSYSISVGLLILIHVSYHGSAISQLLILGICERQKFSWREEMFAVQLKLSISWVFGYMNHQSLVPIIFYILGPVSAGQFGFLMSIVNAVKSLSSTFVAKESPLFGRYIARQQYFKLRSILKNIVKKTFFLITILIVGSFAGLWLLSFFNSEIFTRIPDLVAATIILLVTYIMQFNLILANFVRAHNEEPFMILGIVGGIVLPLSIALSSYLSGDDVVIAGVILIEWIILGIYFPYIIAKPYLELLKDR